MVGKKIAAEESGDKGTDRVMTVRTSQKRWIERTLGWESC
jgi:hypothetical protein